MSEEVITQVENSILIVTIIRHKPNAINRAHASGAAMEELDKKPDIRVGILTERAAHLFRHGLKLLSAGVARIGRQRFCWFG